MTDLSDRVHQELSIPPENQKYMITPKIGLLKFPFPDPEMPLVTLAGTGSATRVAPRSGVGVGPKKIVLMGSTASEIASLSSAASAASRSSRGGKVTIPPARPNARPRVTNKSLEESTYTFTTLRPLPYLPHPERSLAYLARLRDDPGIKAVMRSHRWTVPLLTEMNPVEHTTHESRTLGLNRNRGEVIELRLRTDAYDGYRDYKTIRKTLCHELAHNMYGEHDQDFWRLCREVEKEVERNDWASNGRALTDQEFYTPPEEDNVGHVDGGGWFGGEYILGSNSPAIRDSSETAPVSRRDILAKAAEERIRQQQQQQQPRKGPQ